MGWMVDGGIGYRGASPIGALSACFLAARRSVPQPVGWSYGMERHAGLKALEEVIETVMPPAAGRYRADIQRLRKLGQPIRLGDLAVQARGQKTGGRQQSEQVQRMRAAMEHVASKSRRPYRD